MNFVKPRLLIVFDIGWLAVSIGAAYYNINSDEFRPAFVDLIIWNKWRVTFEAGKISKLYR